MRRCLFALVSGTCVALAFLWPEVLWWLGIAGVALFLLGLQHLTTLGQVVSYSLITGTFKAAGALACFWSAYPLTWLGFEPGITPFVVIFTGWLTSAAVIGGGLVVTGLLLWRFAPQRPWLFLTAPLAWVGGELTGSLTFSIFTLGPGSTINATFSFGYIGYLLGPLEIVSVPVAKLAGVYGLSVLAAALGVGVAWLLAQRSARLRWAAIAGLAVFLAGSFAPALTPSTTPPAPALSVLVIDTHFTSEFLAAPGGYDQKAAATTDAVTAALKHDADIIVLPEDARFTTTFTSSQAALDFIRAQTTAPLLLIDTARTTENGQTFLRSYIYDTAHQKIYQLDKAYLVPGGEYVPYLAAFILGQLSTPSLSHSIKRDLAYRPGPYQTYTDLPANIPGILFCFESVDPRGVRKIVAEHHTPLIVHPVSHAWFQDSPHLRSALAHMLRVQALWNHVTIIEAGNLKTSARYTPDGQIDTGAVIEASKWWTLRRYE